MKIAWIKRFSFAVLFVVVLAFPANADALGPVDVEIGAMAGTATGTFGPLGFGIGGRGGVSIGGLYAGVDVIDYLGATSTCGGCSEPAGASPVHSGGAGCSTGSKAATTSKFPR
jgi:hypothetical protein